MNQFFARPFISLFSALFLICFLSGCGQPDAPQTEPTHGYVGATSCAECHAEQTNLWRDSHHDQAMALATAETVLGDFADAEFKHQGVTTRFYQRDGAFFVEADDRDGNMAEFPIRYTFGVYPLQQYIVELSNGKLQTLGASWDSRPQSEGGQRWFHVYGDDPIDHTDVLHWTWPAQNWDSMCSDCHSTEVRRSYDVDTDQFTTTWKEINVACEACHGPGEAHVDWARNGGEIPNKGLAAIFDERRDVTWIMNPETGNSQRSTPLQSHKELDTCAGCHARRSIISADEDHIGTFLDRYQLSDIASPLYYPDGQLLDETYVVGSFLQSKMHQQGVTCSDCHEPHSLELRAPGPKVCLQCHDSNQYAVTEHHQHAPDSAGADCIECHMPPTTYMQNDPRHDHSIRIPRLALSAELDLPEPCTNCHTDKNAEWAAANWTTATDKQPQHWSAIMARATTGDREAVTKQYELILDETIPAVIRASAVMQTPFIQDPGAARVMYERTIKSDPLIRTALANAMRNAPPEIISTYGFTLLTDDVKSVRIAAAFSLAGMDPVMLTPEQQKLLNTGIQDYIDVQLLNNERAESHVNIGNINALQGRLNKAAKAYQTAIKVNPYYVPAYVYYAEIYRQQERPTASEAVLRDGLTLMPEQAALHYHLGMALVRQARMDDALEELEIAAKSPDSEAMFALGYGLALDAHGDTEAAIEWLAAARERFPADQSLLAALANLYQRTGNAEAIELLRNSSR
ncbi:MAG: tetratricopeptide repeat protein [Gammaproteobacteria bacterium]|nr:tetratricopeptide repeat protein [Gammaproteobacteria bacterium]